MLFNFLSPATANIWDSNIYDVGEKVGENRRIVGENVISVILRIENYLKSLNDIYNK